MENYFLVFRDDGAGSMEVARLFNSLGFDAAKLDNRLQRIADHLGILPTQLVAHPDPGNTLGEANPDEGSYLADIVAGEATNICKDPSWVKPTAGLSNLAREQYRAFLGILPWIINNPTADQTACITQSEGLLAGAIPGAAVLWDATGLLTQMIKLANEQYPGIVPAKTWTAFRDGIAGLTQAQLSKLREWARLL